MVFRSDESVSVAAVISRFTTIELFDIPPRIGDEPRIIGRVSPAMIAVIEELPLMQKWLPAANILQRSHALIPCIHELTNYAQQHQQGEPKALALDRRLLTDQPANSLIRKPRQGFWHYDQNYSLIIGGPNRYLNTEALVCADISVLPYQRSGTFNPQLQEAAELFSKQADSICQPGPYEIMEMSTRTLHCSSRRFRTGNGLSSFIQLNF